MFDLHNQIIRKCMWEIFIEENDVNYTDKIINLRGRTDSH